MQPGGIKPPGTAPQALLTILFFDERFNFIEATDGGVWQDPVLATVGSNGSSLTLPNIKAPKNGYAYIYISNQSNNDVYFDDLQVGISTGNIIEENHYYAYGLKIATLSSKKLGDTYEGQLKNNYLYNGKELFDDADLNWYDYGFRNYDPQIGRFTQLDPLTDSYPFLTPYQYASCDPITNIDIDGLEGVGSVGNIIGTGFTEAAEHGGAVKELTGIVLTSSYAVNRTIKQVQLVLSAGNYIQMANLLVSIINSSPAAKQIGNLTNKSNHTDYLGGSSFKPRMYSPPSGYNTKAINIEKPIGLIGDIAELTERTAKTLGESKLEKISATSGGIATGVTVTYHLLKGDDRGLLTDAGEFIISRTAAAPYYFGAKLFNEIRNSDQMQAKVYMGLHKELMNWIDKMHSLPEVKQNIRNKKWLKYRSNANHYRDVLDELEKKWLETHGQEKE